jgi:hypothetical protein
MPREDESFGKEFTPPKIGGTRYPTESRYNGIDVKDS